MCLAHSSIAELPDQLDDAWGRERLLDSSEGTRIRDVRAGRTPVRMVQGIESLDLEGDVTSVVEVDVLAHREVQVPVPRPGQDIVAGRPELADRRTREATDVDPGVVGTARVGRAVTKAVGSLVGTGRLQRLAPRIPHAEGEAGPRLEDAVQVPAAEERLRQSAPAGLHPAALAEGQLVGTGQAEIVPGIVGRP